MHVLIAPDKFKGTLDARGVATAIAAGWRRARPRDRLDLLPMSDGGDGFGAVLGGLLGARTRTLPTVDAAGRPCRARWWWAAARRMAILETAQSNGLALLPRGRFHPFDLDTTGIGRLVRQALRAGAKTILLGVGGSATNDGGFGLARDAGWRFLDRGGVPLARWTELDRLARCVPPDPPRPAGRFVVATDVDNPLLGRRGATRVYGPQKGLRPEDLAKAEACLRRLATVVRQETGFEASGPGCGAAGGLGFGLQAFFGAERRLGFDLFAELADLDRRLGRADLVVTGEGGFDAQSAMGKGVGQLLARCQSHRRPCVVLAGRVEVPRPAPPAILLARGLTDFVGEAEALRAPARALTRLATEIAATVGEP